MLRGTEFVDVLGVAGAVADDSGCLGTLVGISDDEFSPTWASKIAAGATSPRMCLPKVVTPRSSRFRSGPIAAGIAVCRWPGNDEVAGSFVSNGCGPASGAATSGYLLSDDEFPSAEGAGAHGRQ